MLTKRIIPCLDVKNGAVVKGLRFDNLKVVGDIMQLSLQYAETYADELVFYDITASADKRRVDTSWVTRVAEVINIPFCVAGGIKSVQDAEDVLSAGADKISINSPAIENPNLIDELVAAFGQQCIVIGIDSFNNNDDYLVYQYAGKKETIRDTGLSTQDWIREVQNRGAGEIVLNCVDADGVREGYDIRQLKMMRDITHVPLIASGGAGCFQDFVDVFQKTDVAGALAASVFHSGEIDICDLKKMLHNNKVEVRL